MTARLGNVFYWLGCIGAVLVFALFAILWFVEFRAKGEHQFIIVGVVGALIFWAIGWALRYVLAGKVSIK